MLPLTASTDAPWLCPACLASNAPGGHECSECRAPLRLGEHTVAHELLARRGSARTFAGVELGDGTPVIIKVLGVSGLGEWKELELFQRGIEVLRGLSHPGLPRHRDDGSLTRGGETFYYWVQQRLEGRSVAEGLEAGQRWTEERARALALSLLEILEYLQSFSPPVLHRDVKPANVFERSDGSWALIDFDLVKDTLEPGGGSTTALGTAGYAPLEQLMGRAVPASDLFGVGATLVAVLSRKEPSELVDPDDGRVAFRDHVRVSDDFADFIERLLQPRASDRPTDARAALDELRGAPSRVAIDPKVAEGASSRSDHAGDPPRTPTEPESKALELGSRVALVLDSAPPENTPHVRIGMELTERYSEPRWLLPARATAIAGLMFALPVTGWAFVFTLALVSWLSGYVFRYPVALPPGRALYLGGIANTAEPGRHWLRHRWFGKCYSIANEAVDLTWHLAPTRVTGPGGRELWLELELAARVRPLDNDVGQFRALLNYDSWRTTDTRLPAELRKTLLPALVEPIGSSSLLRRAAEEPVEVTDRLEPGLDEGLEAIGWERVRTDRLHAVVGPSPGPGDQADHVELSPVRP